MPRSHRRRKDEVPLALGRLRGSVTSSAAYQGRAYAVRSVSGDGSTREYLCPGCAQQIPLGTPHVVVWPADGVSGLAERRHWHTRCWQTRDARPSGNAYH